METRKDNVFTYARREEVNFERQLNETGKERKTTFFSDLSIAEWYGRRYAITDTYNRIVSEWLNDREYFQEFVLALYWKSWEWYDRGNEDFARLYSKLYRKADELAGRTYKGDELRAYYTYID